MAQVVEAATAARLGTVVGDGDVGQRCRHVVLNAPAGEHGRIATHRHVAEHHLGVVTDAPGGPRHVSAHRDIRQTGSQRAVDAPAEGGGAVAAHDAVDQGDITIIFDTAPVDRCSIGGDDHITQGKHAAVVESATIASGR